MNNCDLSLGATAGASAFIFVGESSILRLAVVYVSVAALFALTGQIHACGTLLGVCLGTLIVVNTSHSSKRLTVSPKQPFATSPTTRRATAEFPDSAKLKDCDITDGNRLDTGGLGTIDEHGDGRCIASLTAKPRMKIAEDTAKEIVSTKEDENLGAAEELSKEEAPRSAAEVMDFRLAAFDAKRQAEAAVHLESFREKVQAAVAALEAQEMSTDQLSGGGNRQSESAVAPPPPTTSSPSTATTVTATPTNPTPAAAAAAASSAALFRLAAVQGSRPPTRAHASSSKRFAPFLQPEFTVEAGVFEGSEWRSFVSERRRAFLTDDTLLRYLRARDSDETAALDMLMATVRWRADNVDPAALYAELRAKHTMQQQQQQQLQALPQAAVEDAPNGGQSEEKSKKKEGERERLEENQSTGDEEETKFEPEARPPPPPPPPTAPLSPPGAAGAGASAGAAAGAAGVSAGAAAGAAGVSAGAGGAAGIRRCPLPSCSSPLTKPPPRCWACAEVDPCSHCFGRVGVDRAGRHVVYSCAGRTSNLDIRVNMLHMAFEIERLFDHNSVPGKMTWVIDFAGFGLAHSDPRLGATALPMFSSHYPERMGQIVLLDPPALFHGVWLAALPALDPVTKSKVVFLRGASAFKAYADVQWLGSSSSSSSSARGVSTSTSTTTSSANATSPTMSSKAKGAWPGDPQMHAWIEAVKKLPGKTGSFPPDDDDDADSGDVASKPAAGNSCWDFRDPATAEHFRRCRDSRAPKAQVS